MAVTTPPAPTRTAAWTRRALWANVAAQIGIIVTGGAVRLTGSGLGCSTWPQCEPGSFTPEFHAETSIHSYVEFGNRTLTGVLAVIALLLLWLVHRERWRPTWYRRLAVVPIAGVALQGVIGGVTVLAKLHPAVVGLHMLVSLALVAASTVLLVRDADVPEPGPAPAVASRTRRTAAALTVVGAVVMVLGVVVTGAGPHGGDDEHAYRYAVDPVLVAKAHAWAVWVFVALLAACLWWLRHDGVPARTRRAWWVLLAVTLAQALVGYVQYFTGLPEVVVGVHMLGTGVLAASLTWAWCRLVR